MTKTLTTHEADVAIVGGGPAGLSVAIALGLRGVSTIIIEKKSWPIDKVCGEGLMPTGVGVLERLGIMDHLSDDMHRPFYGIRYIDPSGVRAEGRFPSQPGLGIRRIGLSEAMHKRAAGLREVALWNNASVHQLENRDDCIELSITRDDEDVLLRAKLVIGADGLHSKVRQWCGLRAPSPTKQQRWGTRQHFQIEPWTDHVEVYWQDGFEAYVTPSSNNRLQIAFLWDADRFRPKAGARDIIEAFLTHFPELAQKLQNATPEAPPRGIGPLAHVARAAHSHRVLLMGDALGYVDGITGEGVAVALQQAETISAHLPLLLERDDLDDGLARLGGLLQEVYREGFCMTGPALFLTRHPKLRQLTIRGLSRSPGLFSHILASNMGLASPLRPPLIEIPNFVRGMMAPLPTPKALPIHPSPIPAGALSLNRPLAQLAQRRGRTPNHSAQ